MGCVIGIPLCLAIGIVVIMSIVVRMQRLKTARGRLFNDEFSQIENIIILADTVSNLKRDTSSSNTHVTHLNINLSP